MMRAGIFALVVALLLPLAVTAQSESEPPDLNDILETIEIMKKSVVENDEESINAALLPLIRQSSGLRFLQNINFKPKFFDTTDGGSGLGFSYDYYQEIAPRYVTTPSRTRAIQGELKFKGNVAVNTDINPEDFLDSRFAFKLFQNSGGVVKGTKDEYKSRWPELLDALIDIENEDELVAHPANIEMLKLRDALSSQYYLALALHGGLESDQEFKRKNYTYGVELGFVYRSYDTESLSSMLNVFDWPAALIRAITGYDQVGSFTPDGATWPSLLVGIDQVEPASESPRTVVGGDAPYGRFRGELAFRTPVAEVGANRIFFDANYRVYAEIDPADEVKYADLDTYNYVVLTLSSTNGVFASYTDGKLPLDASGKQSYQLGFKFNLGGSD